MCSPAAGGISSNPGLLKPIEGIIQSGGDIRGTGMNISVPGHSSYCNVGDSHYMIKYTCKRQFLYGCRVAGWSSRQEFKSDSFLPLLSDLDVLSCVTLPLPCHCHTLCHITSAGCGSQCLVFTLFAVSY